MPAATAQWTKSLAETNGGASRQIWVVVRRDIIIMVQQVKNSIAITPIGNLIIRSTRGSGDIYGCGTRLLVDRERRLVSLVTHSSSLGYSKRGVG